MGEAACFFRLLRVTARTHRTTKAIWNRATRICVSLKFMEILNWHISATLALLRHVTDRRQTLEQIYFALDESRQRREWSRLRWRGRRPSAGSASRSAVCSPVTLSRRQLCSAGCLLKSLPGRRLPQGAFVFFIKQRAVQKGHVQSNKPPQRWQIWLECRRRLCDFLRWLQCAGVQFNSSIDQQIMYMINIVKYRYWEKKKNMFKKQ